LCTCLMFAYLLTIVGLYLAIAVKTACCRQSAAVHDKWICQNYSFSVLGVRTS